MNKKIKVTSAAAAALASLVLINANVNNEVKADTKSVNATKTTQKAQTPEEAARANVASAQKNYDDANKVLNGDLKTNKDKADAKVVAAQKAYDEAVAKLQAAKDALAKAQQKLQDILDAE